LSRPKKILSSSDKKVDKQNNVTQALFDYVKEEAKAPVASTSGISETSELPETVNKKPKASKSPESIEPISEVLDTSPKKADSFKSINE
ncbi:36443_t:CDS:1, partial [Racocetra persica]